MNPMFEQMVSSYQMVTDKDRRNAMYEVMQRGDYMKDKPFKRGFQQWLIGVWQRKDVILNNATTAEK